MKEAKVKRIVREGYGKIAKAEKCGCGCGCGSNVNEKIGYSRSDSDSVPQGADLNLGCGNPVALAMLKEGGTVIDLGSGGGLDCFLTAKKVGPKGKVTGVDMTVEMLDKARDNCSKGGYKNVKFLLGEIENLPVADNTAEVIISNCVINLSPNKKRVFEEAFRVLKWGGRLVISDMGLLKELPEAVKKSVHAYSGCTGAEIKDAYIKMIENAGFEEVTVTEEPHLPLEMMMSDATAKDLMKQLNLTEKEAEEIFNSVESIKISATKPVSSAQVTEK